MPGSWEITAARDRRILLAILMPPDLGVSMDFSQVIRNLQLPPGSDFMRVVGLPWGPARNSAAKTAVDNKFGALAFLDADVRAPADAYITLTATGLDFIGGGYNQRFWPYQACFFNIGRDAQGNIIKIPITGWKPGDIVPADFVPAGLTLYRRGMLEILLGRHPLLFSWGVDIAPVPDTGGGQVPPFSEDYCMSYRAKVAGFQGFIHTGVWGLHECRAVIGPKWLVPLPSSDPLHGVVGVL